MDDIFNTPPPQQDYQEYQPSKNLDSEDMSGHYTAEQRTNERKTPDSLSKSLRPREELFKSTGKSPLRTRSTMRMSLGSGNKLVNGSSDPFNKPSKNYEALYNDLVERYESQKSENTLLRNQIEALSEEAKQQRQKFRSLADEKDKLLARTETDEETLFEMRSDVNYLKTQLQKKKERVEELESKQLNDLNENEERTPGQEWISKLSAVESEELIAAHELNGSLQLQIIDLDEELKRAWKEAEKHSKEKDILRDRELVLKEQIDKADLVREELLRGKMIAEASANAWHANASLHAESAEAWEKEAEARGEQILELQRRLEDLQRDVIVETKPSEDKTSALTCDSEDTDETERRRYEEEKEEKINNLEKILTETLTRCKDLQTKNHTLELSADTSAHKLNEMTLRWNREKELHLKAQEMSAREEYLRDELEEKLQICERALSAIPFPRSGQIIATKNEIKLGQFFVTSSMILTLLLIWILAVMTKYINSRLYVICSPSDFLRTTS